MANDGAQADSFGSEVAIFGNALVVTASSKTVGSNASQGVAYVYSLVGPTWVQQAELTANNGATNDVFGDSVAMSSNAIVVGAPNKNVGSNVNQGAAYVYSFNGVSWMQQAELTASDGAASDTFGSSVGISGNTAVVGAPNKNLGSNTKQGAAYVYSLNGSAWVQQAELTASDPAAGDSLGYSAAISGNIAVLGAANKSLGSNVGEGAAYVYRFNGVSWAQQAKLLPSDGAANDLFGGWVAISGNTLVVGAGNKTVGSNAGQGVAYVYSFDGIRWVQQAELTASNGAAGDFFGCEAALTGNTLVVGACNKAVGANTRQGAAYLYSFNGSSWAQQQELTASDGAAGDFFGAVALSGNLAVVGAYGKAVGSNLNQGAAYVFASPFAFAPALSPRAALVLAAMVALAGVLGSAKRRTRRASA
jgi:hypothetical protein